MADASSVHSTELMEASSPCRLCKETATHNKAGLLSCKYCCGDVTLLLPRERDVHLCLETRNHILSKYLVSITCNVSTVRNQLVRTESWDRVCSMQTGDLDGRSTQACMRTKTTSTRCRCSCALSSYIMPSTQYVLIGFSGQLAEGARVLVERLKHFEA